MDEINEFREFLDRFENYLNEVRVSKERMHRTMTAMLEDNEDEDLQTYLMYNKLEDWMTHHDQGYMAYKLIRERFDALFGKDCDE